MQTASGACVIIVGEYLRLLDRWGDHHARSQLCAQMLSAAHHQRMSSTRRERQKSGGGAGGLLLVPAQIQLTCTFCNKHLTAPTVHSGGGAPQNRGHSATQLTACPHCRKPLSRCALCRQHMGTACADSDQLHSTFTWCSSCRHGGHLKVRARARQHKQNAVL
jgi:hypothetical protein